MKKLFFYSLLIVGFFLIPNTSSAYYSCSWGSPSCYHYCGIQYYSYCVSCGGPYTSCTYTGQTGTDAGGNTFSCSCDWVPDSSVSSSFSPSTILNTESTYYSYSSSGANHCRVTHPDGSGTWDPAALSFGGSYSGSSFPSGLTTTVTCDINGLGISSTDATLTVCSPGQVIVNGNCSAPVCSPTTLISTGHSCTDLGYTNGTFDVSYNSCTGAWINFTYFGCYTPTGTWTAPTCPSSCSASNPSYYCSGGNGYCSTNSPATLACAATLSGASCPTGTWTYASCPSSCTSSTQYQTCSGGNGYCSGSASSRTCAATLSGASCPTGTWSSAPACPTACGTAASTTYGTCSGGNGYCSGSAPSRSCAATVSCATWSTAPACSPATPACGDAAYTTYATCSTGTLSDCTGTRPSRTCAAGAACPIDGTCGSANGVLYANGSSPYSPYTQCGSGTASVTTPPTAGNTTSWTCSGTNGGAASATCSASQDVADYCGTYSSSTPRPAEPTSGPTACGHGAYANSPADVTTSGAQAWRWSCGTVTSCTAPKYGCTTTTDTNYNATGPGNIYNCANTCANGGTNYPTCTLAPTASLSASPNPVAYATRSTLTWSSTNASSCTAGGAWSNSGTLSGSGLTNPLTSDTTFTFQCTGSGGTSALQSVTVAVGAAAACSLPWGGTIANGVSTTAYQASSVTSPATCASVSESRTCDNGVLSGSYTNQTCSVIPTATLTAAPETIRRNRSATLTWSSGGAASCVATGGFSTGNATSGSASVTPLTTSAYQITCTGSGGSTTVLAQTTITVINPSVTITAAPVRTLSGSSSIISWSSVDATSCAVSGPGLSATGTSGSRTVAITSQSKYVITCQTADSPVTSSVLVNVAPTFKEF